MSKKKTPGSRYWDPPIPLSPPPITEDRAARYAELVRDHKIEDLPYDPDEVLSGWRLGVAMANMTHILKEANLCIESGPPIVREEKLLRAVEGLGYRPYVDKEWYAAKILHQISLVLPGTGKPETAIVLGMLIREADIRFGLISENARKAGQQPKLIRVVDSFVRTAIRKHPTMKSTELWKSISEDDFVPTRLHGGNLYRRNGRLHVVKKVKGVWTKTASLSYAGFRNYVTAARKTTTRKPASVKGS